MKPTALVYSELQQAYDTFNRELFDGTLPDCLLTLQRKDRTMGYFSPARWGNKARDELHEIALNPAFFAVVPLVEIMATIVHEMVHLWQHHHGKQSRKGYHDKQWGDKMESIGLMPSSTGRPGGKKTGDKMMDYPIEGGRFLAVCSQLITQEYKLSWYDRFTEYVPSTTGAAAPGISLNLPAPAMDVAAVTGVAMAALAAGTGTAAPANKSNRSKYTCDCKNAVWGKPGLKLACMSCESKFVEE